MLENMGNQSITGLLSGLVNDLKSLFRQELLLAKSEVAEKISQISSGGISLAIGGAVLFAGFLLLLHSAVLALSNVLTPWLSTLMVGGVAAIIGFILVMKGRSNLKAKNLVPERTMESLKKDKEFAKEHIGR